MTEFPFQSCGRYIRPKSRRQFLAQAGGGLGLLAFGDLLASGNAVLPQVTDNPLTPRKPHFAPKAKSIIWLFMEGGPSGFDLFDPKPELDKNDGKKIKIDVFNGSPGPLLKSPFKFQRYGQSGAWVCDKYQNVARHVDDIAWIKSCFTESSDHVPALYQMNTGIARAGLPALSSWETIRGSKAGHSTGAPAFCPPATRGRSSARKGAPFSICNGPSK